MSEIATVGLSSGVSSGISPSVAAAASSGASTSSAVGYSIRNPRVVQDPLIGFITQYVNQVGDQVVAQFPSTRAVMYMRQGLSSDGSPTPSVIDSSVAATA